MVRDAVDEPARRRPAGAVPRRHAHGRARRSTRSSPGITLIAQLAQVPIQTVIIETDSPYLAQGLAAAARRRRCRCAIRAAARPSASRPRPIIARLLRAARAATSPSELGADEHARRRRRTSSLIPSYDTGPTRLRDGARGARRSGRRSGSSSTAAPTAPPKACARWPRPTRACASTCCRANARQGRRGAARRSSAARAAGFTHALTMDSDGQHPADLIPPFMAASTAQPRRDDPRPAGVRRDRRRCCACAAAASRTAWTNLETLGAGIDDSLYGFRVYPIAPLVEVMRGQPWMRRFDFDTEAVVRLAWRGVHADQPRRAGEVPARRRGRRLALPLRPRQRAADLDAPAPDARLRAAPAAAAARRLARPAAVRRDVTTRRVALVDGGRIPRRKSRFAVA